MGVTLWLSNIAMENGPFIDDLPAINLYLVCGFSMAMSVITRWYMFTQIMEIKSNPVFVKKKKQTTSKCCI